LNCELYWDKTGRPIFKFKNYLANYIKSIDPNFQVNGIAEALYVTSYYLPTKNKYDTCSAGALIHTNTPGAAFEIKRILQDRKVSEMFPGIKHLIS